MSVEDLNDLTDGLRDAVKRGDVHLVERLLEIGYWVGRDDALRAMVTWACEEYERKEGGFT